MISSAFLLLVCSLFSFQSSDDHRDLHSFPTRRSSDLALALKLGSFVRMLPGTAACVVGSYSCVPGSNAEKRSEEHTSELQSRLHLVCRLLLEKKKTYCREDLVDSCLPEARRGRVGRRL